jgi:hypothetical protein
VNGYDGLKVTDDDLALDDGGRGELSAIFTLVGAP